VKYHIISLFASLIKYSEIDAVEIIYKNGIMEYLMAFHSREELQKAEHLIYLKCVANLYQRAKNSNINDLVWADENNKNKVLERINSLLDHEAQEIKDSAEKLKNIIQSPDQQ
jgi:hypothetical protein